ncbi:MAG: HEAT repeat domain-containing protein [Phycisphaerales bacterium]|nr:HEAT repeat domain-containing protein [Phycisphaerales bacterium]
MRYQNRNLTGLTFSIVLLAGSGLPLSTSTAQAATVYAQPESDAQAQRLELLRDFIHFVKIARFDVAADLGTRLMDTGITDEEFVDLVEQSREQQRFEEAIAAGLRVPVLEPIAAQLESMFREGKLDRARNPDEIARNIELLTEGLRARTLARERLIFAGEYAMPQLLDAYLQQKDLALKAQVQRLMVDMGRQAIAPLMTALPELDETSQEAVAEVMGLIPYRTSIPVLLDVHQSTDNAAVRSATARAISRLGASTDQNVEELYALLANSYYNEPAELTSFPNEDHQLAWNFDPGLGLVMVPIRTPVFHEAMAMRMAQRVLERSPDNDEVLALWVAANYSRSFDTPEGYTNPLYGDDRRDAEYFGIAVGPEIDQLVLRRGIDTRDTPLVRSAIQAIAQTAGPRSLWGQDIDGRYPLLESLGYQNRRVQFETALALGNAQPSETFNGSERVIPLLASAVKDASARYAIVLTGEDRESYDQYRSSLERAGFTVLPPAPGGLGDLDASIAESPTIDLIVSAQGFDSTILSIESARTENKTSVSPVLALMGPDDLIPMQRQYGRDQGIAVRRQSISGSAFDQSVETLLEVASGGPISTEEAEEYAARATEVLRNLAISNNEVLNISDAASILINVLEQVDGFTMLDIAEIISYMPQPKAQQAIMDRTMGTDDADLQIEMLTIVADSGKRHGNQLSNRQIRRLIEMAQSENDDLATTAAATMGALQVDNTTLLQLVIEPDSQ